MKVKAEIETVDGLTISVERNSDCDLSDLAELFSTVVTAAWGYEVSATLTIEPEKFVFTRDGHVE